MSAPVTQITVAGARAAGDSVEADTAALTALYTSAGGDNWATNTNWATAEPIGTWFGVTTDGNGRVTGLNLRTNNLVGTLPDELGNLTSLLQIYLQDNQLSGPIPALSGLTSLTHLEMARNQLSGSIPALATLTSLQKIYLQGNQLSGPIPDLSGLTGLTHIYLQDNGLTGTIPDLSGLTSLTHLDLARNGLSGSIPAPGHPHLPARDLPARQRLEWADPPP